MKISLNHFIIMQYIEFVFLFAFLIIWGVINYYTNINENIPRWIRMALWGSNSMFFITLLKILPLLSFSSGPMRKMVLIYCFFLVFISIPSLLSGRWAINSYNRQEKRKAIIISSVNWVIGICVSFYIFNFVIISQDANIKGAFHH